LRLGGRLWAHRDFLKLWSGDTITQFTGQISGLALPTVAILTLDVSGLELGVLNALEFIAFPTLGLFVGVWMDRMKRRPVLIAANLVQVATLATVPAAYFLGVLGLYQLYVVALVMGITTVFYDVAYQSYLPSLVPREDLVEGNQKLQTSASAAQVIGPSVASGLMHFMSAALSVAWDSAGTLAAAFALGLISKPEPEPSGSQGKEGRNFFREMREGIRVVTGNRLLWTQAGCTATANLGGNMFNVAVLLFAFRTLGISKDTIGIAFSIGAVGFLFGVFASSAVTSRLGLGRTIALSIFMNLGELLVLLAGGTFAVLILGAAFFIGGFGIPIYNINQVSLRQIITPNRLQGRMNATMRTIVWGTLPVGALLGGASVSAFGVVDTMIAGALVSGGSSLWIVLGPIFKLKKQPEPVPE
jgi:predicted MFS family arabinose efflux permease